MRSLISPLAGALRLTVTILVPVAFACSTETLGPQPAIESVMVAPSTATVSVGATLSLTAEVRNGSGEMIPSQRVSWASENPEIAEVSASGIVTGRKVGSVLIAASSWGKDAFARVTVNPTPVTIVRLSSSHRSMYVGEVIQLTAEALDNEGHVLANRPITWTTSDPAIATVTDNGAVTALAVGGTIIMATSEGKSAVASVTVAAVPVASITLSPSSSDLVVGQTAELTATVRDLAGNTLTGRSITWGTSNAAVATVTSEGLVTAVSQGTVTITATTEGKVGSASVNVSPRPASAVIISPNQVTVFPTQTMQLSALVTDDRGLVLPGRPVTYATSNPLVATVSVTGLVTGIATGAATITATSESAVGMASVTVLPEPVAMVEVSPQIASVTVGQALQVSALPRNAAGQLLSGRNVTWSSGSPGIATVSALGVVTGMAPGNAVIVATVDGTQGSALITVRAVPVASISVTPPAAGTAVGSSITLSAILRDATGNLLTGRVIGWTSSDNSIATVSNFGVVTGVAIGNVTITATSEGQTGSSSISVAGVPVTAVSVTPPTASLTVGQSTQLSATPRDAQGNVLTGRVVNWSGGSPNVATVSATGVVTGVGIGSTTVTATIDGVSASASITVTQVPVATVTVTPTVVVTFVGLTVQLTATARDANNNVLTGRVITWASTAPGTASVSNGGTVTALAAGTASVSATSEGQVGAATVTVNAAPVVSVISIAPSPTNVIVGNSATLVATARDQYGNTMSGVSFTWTTNDASIATVSGTGVVTGVAVGSTSVTASSGGVSRNATVNVVPVPVDRIVVTPTNIAVDPGQTVQFVATLYDANNNVLTGRTVTWSSSRSTRVAINSNTGLALAIRSTGDVTITASSGGKTGTATIRVN